MTCRDCRVDHAPDTGADGYCAACFRLRTWGVRGMPRTDAAPLAWPWRWNMGNGNRRTFRAGLYFRDWQ